MDVPNPSRDRGPISLTREQRDMLRHEVEISLDGIDDLAMLFRHGHVCLRSRRRFHEALWLADDLGWGFDDPRDTFYVTLPADRFIAWVRETLDGLDEPLHCAAEELADPALHARRYGVAVEEVIASAREGADKALDTRAVCRAILVQLGEPVM